MNNRFRVYEACNGFYLEDLVTGRVAALGDGVGEPYGEIGTGLFCDRWEDDVNSAAAEVFGVYFHDLDNLVIYDNPEFMDRYTVILREATFLEKAVQSCGDLYHCLGLSHNPDSPQGFSQCGYANLEAMEGMEAIHFLDLPENVQRHISMRLQEG
jgi:hypothetical protein